MPGSPSRLPARPSLEQLRKQAKELLRSLRAGDPTAVARLGAVNPRLADLRRAKEVTLAHAQFAVAREYGFETWAKLARHIRAAQRVEVERFERWPGIWWPRTAPATRRRWRASATSTAARSPARSCRLRCGG